MLEVIYEDNHLLVLNKPAGLLTQPSGTEQDSLESQAKQWIKEKYNKPGNVFLEAVHRLDKPASGIVVFAKTSKALSRLNEAMRAKKSKKVYLALVEDHGLKEEDTLEHYLVHDDYKATISTKKDPQAKLARLFYRVIERDKNHRTALVEVVLDTGRYHQIRAQLAAMGCPIFWDAKYGSRMTPVRADTIALHHAELRLPHPISGEMLCWQAPRPDYLRP